MAPKDVAIKIDLFYSYFLTEHMFWIFVRIIFLLFLDCCLLLSVLAP